MDLLDLEFDFEIKVDFFDLDFDFEEEDKVSRRCVVCKI